MFQPTNYNFAKCRADRYQPKAFVTNGNTDCIFQKSSCSEEGQVVCKNLSTEEDAACICDYTKGYTFVSNTMNPCYCVPSKEDCSCFKLDNISEVGKYNINKSNCFVYKFSFVHNTWFNSPSLPGKSNLYPSNGYI